MIRANLLPRPKEHLNVFGFRIDAEYFKETMLALLAVSVVALTCIAFEYFRAYRLAAASIDAEAIIASQSDHRRKTHEVALDLARLQALERATGILHNTGNDAALAIARIGNPFPAGTWLDAISVTNAGAFRLSGGARDIDSLSVAIRNLAHAGAGGASPAVDIADPDQGALRFTIRASGALAPGGSRASATMLGMAQR